MYKDANRIYGSKATTSAANMSRAWRKDLAHLLARGPRPGVETKVHNVWEANHKDSQKEAA